MANGAVEGAVLSFGLVLEVAGLEVMIPMYTVYCCCLQQAANKETASANIKINKCQEINSIQSIHLSVCCSKACQQLQLFGPIKIN